MRMAVVVLDDGGHLISADRMGTAELYPADERRFFSLGEIPDVAFTVDQQGGVTGFSSGGLQARRTP